MSSYTKEEVIRLRQEGKPISEIHTITKIPCSTLYRWTKGIDLDVDDPCILPVLDWPKSPKAIGEISQLAILARLAVRGYVVLLPYGDSLRYDIALDIEGKLVRIQCKTGRLRRGIVRFFAYSKSNGKDTRDYKGQIEHFGVYCPELNKCYLVPVDHVGTSEGSLRVDLPKNGQQDGIMWAKDYEI